MHWPQAKMTIEYTPRWKEELIGVLEGNQFVVELTMGRLHVYFPSESTWESSAPDWAKGKYLLARTAAEDWSSKNDSDFTVDENAWIDWTRKE